MTIEVRDGTYFSSWWFVSGPGKDWMAAVFRPPGEPWQVKYRFRYYKDDRAHDSADESSWYEVRGPSGDESTEHKLCAITDRMAGMTAAYFGGSEVHKLLLKTDRAEQVMAALGRESWAHAREEGG